MRDDANLLKFTMKESLPKNTYALQLENGKWLPVLKIKENNNLGIVFYIKMNDWELSVKLEWDFYSLLLLFFNLKIFIY